MAFCGQIPVFPLTAQLKNIFFLGIGIRFELNRSESLEFRTPALPGFDTGFLAVAYKADLHPNRLSIHF